MPHPTTTAISPGLIPDFRTACTAIVAGSSKEISSSDMLSGTGIILFIGQTIYSCKPPSADNPATAIDGHTA